jgi:predicted nucleic acid-binding protein
MTDGVSADVSDRYQCSLRIFRQDDPEHRLVRAALDELAMRGVETCFALQNIAEFWNVCTRPLRRNGYGLSISDTNLCIESIERTMTYLPDTEDVYSIWRRLVIVYEVRGVQLHDARLAALMQVHGLTRILTLNQVDFLRYVNLQAIHPRQVLPSLR